MASTYNALKIQLMATGDNDTTWGDVTNQNFAAFTQAIVETGAVTMAAADQTLTLIDSNASQPARAARLLAGGTTGAATRSLTLAGINKPYQFVNACADPITVKEAIDAGITVPGGMSTLLYSDGNHVTSPINWLPSLQIDASVTQPQFDNTTKVATDQFVQRAIGSFANEIALSAGQALTAAHVSCHLQLNTANATFTLPLASSVPLGAAIRFHSGGNGNIIAASSGDNLWSGPGVNLASITLAAGDDLVAIRSTPVAWTVEGTGAFQNANITVSNFYASNTLSIGGALNVAGASNVGAIVASGSVSTPWVLIGPHASASDWNGFRIEGDDSTWSTIYFRYNGGGTPSYINYSWANATIYMGINGTQVFSINTGGCIIYTGLTTNGSLTVNGNISVSGSISYAGGNYFGFKWNGYVQTVVDNATVVPLIKSGFSSGNYFAVLQLTQNINGNMYADLGQAGFTFDHSVSWATSQSDRRLKFNLKPASLDALATINKIKVWACDMEPLPGLPRQPWDCALVADEMEPLIPRAFIPKVDEEKGLDGISLLPVVATLVRAVQQLTARLQTAEAKLTSIA